MSVSLTKRQIQALTKRTGQKLPPATVQVTATKPIGGSAPELELERQLAFSTLYGFDREGTFETTSKRRIDFFNRELMIAVEVQGGLNMTCGWHSSETGAERDYEKLLAMQLAGYMVVMVSSRQVFNGRAVQMIEAAVRYRRMEKGETKVHICLETPPKRTALTTQTKRQRKGKQPIMASASATLPASKYIKASLLDELEVDSLIVKIAKWEFVTFEANGDRKAERKIALTFDEIEDQTLTLNATNTRFMIAEFGDDTDDWPGNVVKLMKTKVRNPNGGGMVDSLLLDKAPKKRSQPVVTTPTRRPVPPSQEPEGDDPFQNE